MSRQSMEAIVSRVRTLIGDSSNNFSDDQIEQVCDNNRSLVWFRPLRPLPTFIQGQTTKFLNYIADGDVGMWESDYVLQRADFTTIEHTQVSSFEPIPGQWFLTADSGEQGGIRGMSVRITGKAYDIYNAAAELCTAWAGQLAREFSFSGDNQTFERTQQYANLIDLAKYYRTMAQPVSSRQYSGDYQPDNAGSGVTYPNLGSGAMIP